MRQCRFIAATRVDLVRKSSSRIEYRSKPNPDSLRRPKSLHLRHRAPANLRVIAVASDKTSPSPSESYALSSLCSLKSSLFA